MNTDFSGKKTVPVPGRGKNFDGGTAHKRKKTARAGAAQGGTMWIRASVMAAAAALTAISVFAGVAASDSLAAGAAADGWNLDSHQTVRPVVLANGQVIMPPCYITVDGKKVALVDSEETAEQVIQSVIGEYRSDCHQILDIEIEEDTGIETMALHHGDDPPQILTAAEAKEKITAGNQGESYITVITTEETTETEAIAFTEEYKPEPEMYAGESRVETEGREGTLEITKKITSENGETVEEEILEEEVLQEPVQQVILTGTKAYDGYGGGDGSYGDDNVSRDEAATYGILGLPVENFTVSSPFGPRWGTLHTGIDLALAQGNPVYAADSGTVYFSGWGGGYGNLVKIDHGNGMQTYYAHCSQLLVSQGQYVERGQQIALVGSTGNSTGPHVHFEVIINGSCVDPADFLPLE